MFILFSLSTFFTFACECFDILLLLGLDYQCVSVHACVLILMETHNELFF